MLWFPSFQPHSRTFTLGPPGAWASAVEWRRMARCSWELWGNTLEGCPVEGGSTHTAPRGPSQTGRRATCARGSWCHTDCWQAPHSTPRATGSPRGGQLAAQPATNQWHKVSGQRSGVVNKIEMKQAYTGGWVKETEIGISSLDCWCSVCTSYNNVLVIAGIWIKCW